MGIVAGGLACASDKEVLRDAEAAMYKANMAGKNPYALFNEIVHTAALAHLPMASGLRRVVERGEFVMLYQPTPQFGRLTL